MSIGKSLISAPKSDVFKDKESAKKASEKGESKIRKEADLSKAGDGEVGNFRNYNLGRNIDKSTPEFERELDDLVKKYNVHMETETFQIAK